MNGIGEVLGIKLATLVAGFIGAIASLAYMRELTPSRAFLAIVVGTGCAAYVTPLVESWLRLEGTSGENAAAFIVGVVGMNLVGALYRGGEKLREKGIEISPTPPFISKEDGDDDN